MEDHGVVEDPADASSEGEQSVEDNPGFSQLISAPPPGGTRENRQESKREYPVLITNERASGNSKRAFDDIRRIIRAHELQCVVDSDHECAERGRLAHGRALHVEKARIERQSRGFYPARGPGRGQQARSTVYVQR